MNTNENKDPPGYITAQREVRVDVPEETSVPVGELEIEAPTIAANENVTETKVSSKKNSVTWPSDDTLEIDGGQFNGIGQSDVSQETSVSEFSDLEAQTIPPLPENTASIPSAKAKRESETNSNKDDKNSMERSTPLVDAKPVQSRPVEPSTPRIRAEIYPRPHPIEPDYAPPSPPPLLSHQEQQRDKEQRPLVKRYWMWATVSLALLVVILAVVLGVVLGRGGRTDPPETTQLPNPNASATNVPDTPSSSQTPAPTDPPVSTLTDPPVPAPTDPPVPAPTDPPVPAPTDPPVPAPTDPPVPAPTDPPVPAPTDPPVPAPTDPPVPASTDPPVPAPTDPPTPAPTIPPTVLDELVALFSTTSPGAATALRDKTSNQYQAMEWLEKDVEENGFDLSTDEDRILARGALAILFYSTEGDGWSVKTGWLEHGVSECDWNDVKCTSGIVTTLDFYPGNNLEGTLPRELHLLTGLDYLDVSWHSLTGTLPTEFGLLTYLQNLSVHKNSLTGTVTTELAQLTNLEWLSVSSNSLSGTVPTELGELEKLETLWLAENEFTGQVPSEVCAIDSLTGLLADCGGSSPKIECTCCTKCCPGAVGCS